jgi:hypothetical protein
MPSCGSGAGLGDSEKRTRIFGFHLAGEVTSPFTTETGAIALGQTLPLAAEKACFRRPKNLRFRTGHVGRCPRKGGNAMFRTLSLSLLLASSVSLANAQQQVPVDDGGVSGTLTSFEEETTGPPVDISRVSFRQLPRIVIHPAGRVSDCSRRWLRELLSRTADIRRRNTSMRRARKLRRYRRLG